VEQATAGWFELLLFVYFVLSFGSRHLAKTSQIGFGGDLRAKRPE
jgi:hypothetical protein